MNDRAGDDGNRAGRHAPEFARPRSSPTPPDPTPDRRTPGIPSAQVRRRRAVLLLAATMSCLVLLTSGTSWALTEWVSGKLNRFNVFEGLFDGDRPEGPKGALTFLVIGSDDRGDSAGDGGARSDSMMLVHLNNDRDHVNVVGIPRDSWVDIPGHGKDKINAAYSYGGPQLAVQTVESTTNVRIDHYAEVDFSGFSEVVDAVGGIEVCLPEPIDDPKAHLTMDAGTHEVDGEDALAFARTRKTAGGDLDRIDRQHQVISALLQKALSSETLSDPGRFATFLDTALGAVTVDEGLDTATLNQLGDDVANLGMDNVTFAQVPVAETDYWTPRGDVAVRWDEDAAHALFADINADQPINDGDSGGSGGHDTDERPHPKDVQLRVFNGTGTPGVGEEVRSALSDAGYATSATAENWSSRGVAATLVRHAPDDAKAAALVSESIPGSTPHQDTSLSEEVQVVVGSNYSTVQPSEPMPSSGPDPSGDSGGDGNAEVRSSTARDNVCE